MNNKRPFPVINTARLRLRKPLQKDAGPLLEVSRDEAVMQYYGMSSFKSKADALAEIAWFNRIFACAQGIRWVITEQGGGQYIGDIGFTNHVPAHSRAEIGFKLAQAWWRKGIMAEALGQVLEYGFTEMQLNRIEAVVDPGNAACLALLDRAGFVQEGLLREYEHEAKGFVDLVMLSLLKKTARHALKIRLHNGQENVHPMNDPITIHEMQESDAPIIPAAFTAQGWDKPLAQYRHYWQDSLAGKRLILLAKYAGEFAGYVTVVWESDYPPFLQAGIPEMSDFNVLIKFRRRAVGTALLDEAEQRIAARSPIAGLGVGLLADYGPAQVLYARRGYVPDGCGISSNGRYPKYGEQVRVDDDLCLYLTRDLTEKKEPHFESVR